MTKTEAIKKAHKIAFEKVTTGIVYFDDDYNTYRACSLEHWEFLCDTNQVSENDFEGEVE